MSSNVCAVCILSYFGDLCTKKRRSAAKKKKKQRFIWNWVQRPQRITALYQYFLFCYKSLRLSTALGANSCGPNEMKSLTSNPRHNHWFKVLRGSQITFKDNCMWTCCCLLFWNFYSPTNTISSWKEARLVIQTNRKAYAAPLTKWVYRYSIHIITITILVCWNSPKPECIIQCPVPSSIMFVAIYSVQSIARSAAGKQYSSIWKSC